MYLIFFPIKAWLVMLTLGMIHHDFVSEIPALGFWQTVVLIVLVDMLLIGSPAHKTD